MLTTKNFLIRYMINYFIERRNLLDGDVRASYREKELTN
jgi:hypothetical protein